MKQGFVSQCQFHLGLEVLPPDENKVRRIPDAESCTGSRCRAYTLDCGDNHFDQLDCSESSDRGPPGVAESCWSSGWASKQEDTVKRERRGPNYKRDGGDLFG